MTYFHYSEEWLIKKISYFNKIITDSKNIYVIGSHRFDEYDTITSLFPNLNNIYLFEPNPIMIESLKKIKDPRIKIFETAITNHNRDGLLYITDNDGASSSIDFKSIKGFKIIDTIKIVYKTLPTMILDEKLKRPHVLLIDVEGAEYSVLYPLMEEYPEIKNIKMIYVETRSDKTLEDIIKLVKEYFVLIGFVPLDLSDPTLGNALFINRRYI